MIKKTNGGKRKEIENKTISKRKLVEVLLNHFLRIFFFRSRA
jgi:hypothetical protein